MRILVFLIVFVILIIPLYAKDMNNKEVKSMDVYGKYVIKPLAFDDVKVHGDLKRQFDEVCRYYYNISNDDLLKPYRERAGLPAPGSDMGGVYIGHSPFGQFLAGYAKMYAVTKDKKYKEKAVYLMHEWGKTIEKDGFFFDNKTPFLSAYYYEKLLGGLLDIYYYCDAKEALIYIDRITAWEEANVPRTRVYCDTVGQGTGEWYTQSENLYRAYIYTKDTRYKDFAQVWEYNEFWDEILNKDYENMYKKSGWHHAYSHTNSFNGLAAAYIAKGDKKYLDTLKAAYDFMQNEQVYATGGFGSGENLGPRDVVVDQIKRTNHNFETQCGSWAAFKMTKYLLGLTGEAKYANWTEKLIINGIGASIPMSGNGSTFYYSEYRTSGAVKRYYHDAGWPCCSGTRPQAISDYYNLLYFYDNDSIYVAQYFASDANFKIGKVDVKLIQNTVFPEENTTRIKLDIDTAGAKFNLKFRIPDWLSAPMVINVNGRTVKPIIEKGWNVINRTWKNGDSIEIKLPMELYVSKIDPKSDYPYAVMYGPITLAAKDSADAGIDNPATEINPFTVKEDFKRATADYMTWKMKSNPSIVLKPFYAYKDGQRYFLYLDKDATLPITSFKKAKYTGDWKSYSDWMSCFTPGGTCEVNINASKLRIHYYGYDDCGIMDVYVDDNKIGIIDVYDKTRGTSLFKDFDMGEYGLHKVKLVASNEKNPLSTNVFVNVAKFEVID